MKCRLSDICFYVKGKVAVDTLDKKTYISTENMRPNKAGIEKASSFPNVELTQAYQAGDVLVSNIRPYFKKIWHAEFDGGCSNDVLVFRAKDNINPDYLYYVLANNEFFDYSMSTAKGTKMPRGDKIALMKYKITQHSFDTQRKIAEILKAIDNKISINRKINENLLQQSEAIFTDFFIANANPTWKYGNLSDMVTICYGKDHKKLNDGPYPVYGSGGIMRYVEKAIYDKESVLIPRKGSLNNVMYVNEPFWSVDTMFYTKMKMPNIAKFIFHFMDGKNLISYNSGSAVPSMTTDILNSMELQIPDSATLSKFENIIAPMFLAMQQNTQESRKIAELRDMLMPRLMSGELDVSNLDL